MLNRREESRLPVADEVDLVQAVMHVGHLAQQIGFSVTTRARLMTAVSELGRNILKYANEGTILISPIDGPPRRGIQIVATDDGPGIADVDKSMQDHFSTSGTLGLGLPGVQRMMDEFQIVSAPNRGTSVTVRKWLS